jgi:putative glycerol-1-phosphate prenyltransferase
MDVYSAILQSRNKKKFALLIDPDSCSAGDLEVRLQRANDAGVDFVFLGGSLITRKNFDECVANIRRLSKLPLVLFPGNDSHIHPDADAVLFLSLISGRNPELLIGKHVHSAPLIRKMGLESIPTGYMLIESGRLTTAQYMSGSLPIPHDKPDVAMATAIAGEMLGLKLIYMDAGSGAEKPVSAAMIRKVRENIELPLIVGGGIRTIEAALDAARAGADIIVVGNAIEQNADLIYDLTEKLHRL